MARSTDFGKQKATSKHASAPSNNAEVPAYETAEVASFVKTLRDIGKTEAYIKTKLQNSGISEDDIESAMGSNSSSSTRKHDRLSEDAFDTTKRVKERDDGAARQRQDVDAAPELLASDKEDTDKMAKAARDKKTGQEILATGSRGGRKSDESVRDDRAGSSKVAVSKSGARRIAANVTGQSVRPPVDDAKRGSEFAQESDSNEESTAASRGSRETGDANVVVKKSPSARGHHAAQTSTVTSRVLSDANRDISGERGRNIADLARRGEKAEGNTSASGKTSRGSGSSTGNSIPPATPPPRKKSRTSSSSHRNDVKSEDDGKEARIPLPSPQKKAKKVASTSSASRPAVKEAQDSDGGGRSPSPTLSTYRGFSSRINKDGNDNEGETDDETVSVDEAWPVHDTPPHPDLASNRKTSSKHQSGRHAKDHREASDVIIGGSDEKQEILQSVDVTAKKKRGTSSRKPLELESSESGADQEGHYSKAQRPKARSSVKAKGAKGKVNVDEVEVDSDDEDDEEFEENEESEESEEAEEAEEVQGVMARRQRAKAAAKARLTRKVQDGKEKRRWPAKRSDTAQRPIHTTRGRNDVYSTPVPKSDDNGDSYNTYASVKDNKAAKAHPDDEDIFKKVLKTLTNVKYGKDHNGQLVWVRRRGQRCKKCIEKGILRCVTPLARNFLSVKCASCRFRHLPAGQSCDYQDEALEICGDRAAKESDRRGRFQREEAKGKERASEPSYPEVLRIHQKFAKAHNSAVNMVDALESMGGADSVRKMAIRQEKNIRKTLIRMSQVFDIPLSSDDDDDDE